MAGALPNNFMIWDFNKRAWAGSNCAMSGPALGRYREVPVRMTCSMMPSATGGGE